MFDTLKYSRSLEAVGVPREQAEAHIVIISEIVESNLATKQDIKELENKLVQLEYRLTLKLGTVVGAIVTFAIAATAAITKLL